MPTVIVREPYPIETPDEDLSQEISLQKEAGAIRGWVEIKNDQKILCTEWNEIGQGN